MKNNETMIEDAQYKMSKITLLNMCLIPASLNPTAKLNIIYARNHESDIVAISAIDRMPQSKNEHCFFRHRYCFFRISAYIIGGWLISSVFLWAKMCIIILEHV